MPVIDRSYGEIVMEMAKDGSKEAFSCRQPEHASIVYRVLFEGAKHDIRILDKHLSLGLFDDSLVYQELERAIGRGVYVDIVAGHNVDNPLAQGNLDRLVETYDSSVSYLQIPKKLLLALRTEGMDFVVVDSKGVRFVGKKDNAFAWMNKPKIARKLIKSIDLIKSVNLFLNS